MYFYFRDRDNVPGISGVNAAHHFAATTAENAQPGGISFM